MNNFTHNAQTLLEQQRPNLEITLQENTRLTVDQPARLRHFFGRLGNTLVQWLTQKSTLRTHRSTQGETEVWEVYDPRDHRTHFFTHENEVRIWLEERYYR
jgi:hypothetical protein